MTVAETWSAYLATLYRIFFYLSGPYVTPIPTTWHFLHVFSKYVPRSRYRRVLRYTHWYPSRATQALINYSFLVILNAIARDVTRVVLPFFAYVSCKSNSLLLQSSHATFWSLPELQVLRLNSERRNNLNVTSLSRRELRYSDESSYRWSYV